MCRHFAAIVAELYPLRRERWWEVTMDSMAICAAIVESRVAGGYFPEELRLERVAVGG